MKHRALLIGVAAACAWSSATAAGDAPIRWRSHGVGKIFHSSMRPITIQTGDNLLDRLHTFTCHSVAGCVVIAEVSDQQTGGTSGTSTCAFVDGVAGAPGCIDDTEFAINIREQFQVAQGDHTIQSIVHSLNPDGQIVGWAVEYSIYERHVPAD
jgi:hypothetical protein